MESASSSTRAAEIRLDDFIEAATAAAWRAIKAQTAQEDAEGLNPQPLPPRRGRPGLIIGIIIDPNIAQQ
jgi:hypothetical protein